MDDNSWMRKAPLVAGPALMVAVALFLIERRTDDNVRRMAEACERMGQALQIERISWGGGVWGECIPRVDR